LSVPTRSDNSPGETQAKSQGDVAPKKETAAPRRRRRWLLALSGVLILTGAVLAGSWLWQKHCQRQIWEEIQSRLQRRDLQGASVLLDQYVGRVPGDPAGWFLAGRTARRLGHVQDGQKFLERCQELGGVTSATELEWDLLRVQQGQLQGTDARLRMNVGPEHPDAALVLEALARGYLKRERLNDAFQACELWLKLEPTHPRPLLWRGWIRQRLNQIDLAFADYQKAVESAPDDADARLALGNLLLKMRKPAEATEHFQRILQNTKDHPEASVGLAACRFEAGEPALAVPLLDRVLAAQPDNPAALLLRGRAALELGEVDKAAPLLRRAVAADSSSPEALHQLIQCLTDQGKKVEAKELNDLLQSLVADLRRLDALIREIGRDPFDMRHRHEAGVIALRIGLFDDGLKCLEGALECPGDQRPTHAVLADYYQKKGEPERADFHRRAAEKQERP
jgi:Tfp pilus assembly protein PilF